jgi:hypothetical protein
MPRSFDMATTYEGTVEQVHSAFLDEQYWLARLADSGADDARLDSIELLPDGGVQAITTQVLRAFRLPGVVTQFHPGDISIHRTEQWGPVNGGKADGTVTGSITLAPVSLTATAALGSAARGARLSFHATVEVRIPLVGGKLENFIGSQLVNLLTAEQRFTTAWIAASAR